MRTFVVAVGLILLISLMMLASTGTPTVGENVYRLGTLASGAPLTGSRESGGLISGATAACVNCHRPSGLGMVEGRTVIPPITSKYLFRPGVLIAMGGAAHHPDEAAASGRSAYTDVTLARAIREGIGPDGRPLNYLMPRYKLDDAAMSSLIAYLKQLSGGPVPGVTTDTLHFATIITPDADSAKREGMIDVLEHFFAAKNTFYQAKAPPLRSTYRFFYPVQRRWQLHIWELTGAPATWEEQLNKRLQAEPVFAVISGLAGKNWEPIHRFCEQQSLPCLFPNVDLPVVAEGDFYNVYFSKGVLLEAQLIARQIQETAGTTGFRRVVQIYREDDIGSAAAKALRDAISSADLNAVSYVLSSRDEGGELAGMLKRAGAGDALVLWLRPEDLQKLPEEPAKSSAVFVSGIMGGLENSPLKGPWRSAAQMTYPFELPARRAVLLNYPLGWFRIQKIPVIAEQTQIDTYVACSILAESLGEMLDNFVRDYLVENVENMLSSRIVNGYYTRLGLAPGQRFASKGGYIVRFASAGGEKLAPEGDWIVP